MKLLKNVSFGALRGLVIFYAAWCLLAMTIFALAGMILAPIFYGFATGKACGISVIRLMENNKSPWKYPIDK